MYCLRKLRSFGVNSDMLVTFYNAVMCSLIMFGFVCWAVLSVRIFQTLIEGDLKRWYRKEQVMSLESHWKVLRHFEKGLYKNLLNGKWQILNGTSVCSPL